MLVTPLTGLVVCLDDVPLDDLVGPVEVLIQEGFSNFSLPVTAGALEEAIEIFGLRVRFGVHGVVLVPHVERAAMARATFAFMDVAVVGIPEMAGHRGMAAYPPAMTPTEVRDVLRNYGKVSGVQLYPADVMGHVMAQRLATIGLAESVVPRGGVGAYAADEWFKAGARAVCVDSALLGDALTGGDLASLRDRCGSFLRIQPAS